MAPNLALSLHWQKKETERMGRITKGMGGSDSCGVSIHHRGVAVQSWRVSDSK